MSTPPERLGLEIDKINYKFKNLLRFLLLFSVINFETHIMSFLKQKYCSLGVPSTYLHKIIFKCKMCRGTVYFGKNKPILDAVKEYLTEPENENFFNFYNEDLVNGTETSKLFLESLKESFAIQKPKINRNFHCKLPQMANQKLDVFG